MKNKFYVTVVDSEYWDTKGERATPNINVDVKTYDTIDKARQVLTEVVSKFSNPDEYTVDWVEFRCDHCDIRCIKHPSPGHHDFPIRTTVHAEITVLNNKGNMVASSWFTEEYLKKMGA